MNLKFKTLFGPSCPDVFDDLKTEESVSIDNGEIPKFDDLSSTDSNKGKIGPPLRKADDDVKNAHLLKIPTKQQAFIASERSLMQSQSFMPAKDESGK